MLLPAPTVLLGLTCPFRATANLWAFKAAGDLFTWAHSCAVVCSWVTAAFVFGGHGLPTGSEPKSLPGAVVGLWVFPLEQRAITGSGLQSPVSTVSPSCIPTLGATVMLWAFQLGEYLNSKEDQISSSPVLRSILYTAIQLFILYSQLRCRF